MSEVGDLARAREWDRMRHQHLAEIEQSVRSPVHRAHAAPGRVGRTGHHGRRIDGLDTCGFEDASEIPVAIFPQHTSRNGDPQLHVRILWLNKVKIA